MTIIIRKLDAEDFDKEFFNTLSNLSDIGNIDRHKAILAFNETSSNPVYHMFVAEDDGKVVGTVTLLIEQKFFRHLGKVGHLENVVTKKGHEGKGIGGQLVRHAVKAAKDLGCYKAILTCNENLIPYYEKHGFRTVGAEMRLDFDNK